jgi:hypothetical protein
MIRELTSAGYLVELYQAIATNVEYARQLDTRRDT